MQNRLIAVVLLAIFALTGKTISAQQGNHQATRFGWMTDYQAARTLARKTGKPLMVVFRCVP